MVFGSQAHGTSYLGGLPDAYLRSPVGATAFALGGAGIASPEYLQSWWNPAALSLIKRPQGSLGGGLRALGRGEGFASLEYRVPPRLGIGAALLYRGDPFLDNLRDKEGDALDKGAYTTLTWKMGAGYLLTRNVSVGLTFTMYYQNLPQPTYEGSGILNAWVLSLGGIDAALRYRVRDNWIVSATLRDVNGSLNWQFESSGFDQTTSGTFPIAFILGSRYTTRLLERPLIWYSDLKTYAFDSEFQALPRMVAVLNNGFEWQGWESFVVRAGIAELSFTSDLFRNTDRYGDEFSFSITAGFGAQLDRVAKGLALNYGLAVNKVWAGVDQQMDVTYEF